MVQSVQIRGTHVNVINGAIDLNVQPTGTVGLDSHLSLVYGDWSLPSAGGSLVKRSQVSADVDVVISNQRDAGNGAVTFNVSTHYHNFKRTLINDQPVILPYTIHIYGSQERANEKFSTSGNIQSSANYPDVSFNYDVTVPALGTVYVGLGRYWNDIGNSNIDDEFNGGLDVYNPNPPDYRPGSRMINGVAWSHNRGGGKCERWSNSAYEMRTVDGHNASGNPPEIWLNGSATNQLKLDKES